MSSAAPPSKLPTAAAAAAAAPAPAPKKKKTTAKKASSNAGTQAKVKKVTTKRKKTVKKESISAETILAQATMAESDLAKQRATAAARRSDALWYRIEDIPSLIQTPMTSATLPEQVSIVESALANVGLTRANVTPQAMAMLLEQARRYAQELVGDALDYAATRGCTEYERSDLQLAVEMQPQKSAITAQLVKLNLLALQHNRAPLPPIPKHCYMGVVLPPKSQTLLARHFDIVNSAAVSQKMIAALPQSPAQKQQQQAAGATTTSSSSGIGSYGAARARQQIPIHLKPQQPQAAPAAAAPPMNRPLAPKPVTGPPAPTNP